jgi:hypothetical protein
LIGEDSGAVYVAPLSAFFRGNNVIFLREQRWSSGNDRDEVR